MLDRQTDRQTSDTPLISVIIPVYNVEKYLDTCVSSVVNQTYRNLEIILVDDGSPDRSGDICEAWTTHDERIRAIHKSNGGLSDARNAGLAKATGDYVLFLDSDDFWDDENALRYLVNRVIQTRADVLNFPYKKYYESTGKKICFLSSKDMPIDMREKAEQLRFLTERGLYIACAWNKLIRKALLTSDMLFQPGVYSEDIEWCARLMKKAGSMDFLACEFYCYRQRESSITHSAELKRAKDLCSHILTCLAMTKTAEPELKESLRRYTAYQYGTFFMVQAQTAEIPQEYIKRLAKYKGILRYDGGSRKLKILRLSCGLIGYENTCRLIRCVFGRKGR